MAAVLDTRAFRLAWSPGTSVFELDQPEILREKEQILSFADVKPGCERIIIPVDRTGSWKGALVKVGFEPGQSSAWLLEGFLFHIHNEAIIKLLDEVTNLSAPGNWLGFDIINSLTLTSPYTRQWVEVQARSGAPWIGILNNPAGFLSARGWKATFSQAGEPDANPGRWHLPVIPVALSSMPHNWFISAQKISNNNERKTCQGNIKRHPVLDIPFFTNLLSGGNEHY
jgi:methyltransferase (TIGR00027 family)